MQDELRTETLSSSAWPGHLLLAAWLAAGAVAIVMAFGSQHVLPLLDGLLGPLKHHVTAEKAVYSPLAYFCLLSVVYLLERRVPVRDQAFFSASFWQDALWYPGSMLFRILFLSWYVALLHTLYQQYFQFLTIEAVSDWHPALRFIAAALLADFTRWLSHLIRHKVPLFWRFHAVHHSQRNLNLFTDARVHPVDRMISATLRFLPLMMFSNATVVILLWAIFETIYPKFYHGNIRLNLGPLRYILVTPQSHRIHHASEAPYRDKNFGFTFSIWDRLFGTHHKDDNAYPETGVQDEAYPVEDGLNPRDQAGVFMRLLIHPFLHISRTNKRGEH